VAAAAERGAELLRAVPLGTRTFAGVRRGDALVAAWLGAEEAARLGALGGPREAALRFARSGDMAAAEHAMGYARAGLGSRALSPGAMLLARSLHHAAEAYLHYRNGFHDDAVREVEAALACNDTASDEHRYPGAEARRLHLAHVMVRVLRVRGDDPLAVVETVSRLWRYVEGGEACWPLAPLARPPVPVDPRMAAITLNEIVTEAAVLMGEHRELAGDALAVLRPHLTVPADGGEDVAAYPRAWLRLKALRHGGAAEPFLSAAAEFLAEVDGPRPLLWFSALADAHHVCVAMGSRAARAAAERIARAAEGVPGDVPACLRIAAGEPAEPARAGV
jgi:hypothetical protein